MRQATKRPASKVTAAGVSGAIAAIAAWLLAEFAGVDMPAGVEAAFATVIAFVVGYLKEDEPNFDHEVPDGIKGLE